MGDALLPPTVSNRYGYFEDRRLGALNIRLIDQILEWNKFNRLIRRRISPAAHTDQRCFWLAAPRRVKVVEPTRGDRKQMEQFMAQVPFCYKLPHFNTTLPSWRPFLPSNTRFIVVYRQPDKTVDSMLRDACEVYDPPLAISRRWAYTSWLRNYRRLLLEYSEEGEWLFVHYDQVLSMEALPALENFCEVKLDTSQIDKRTSRANPDQLGNGLLGKRTWALYQELCERSARDVHHWGEQTRLLRACDR